MTLAARWPFPGLAWGEYPEQDVRAGAPRRPRRAGIRALHRFADAAAVAGTVPADELPRRLAALSSLAGEPEAWLLEATVLAASALAAALGHAPHRQQLFAARVLLDDRLAEMATGEGKTAAIAMAAAVAALASTPVHVVTANDYLAERDAVRLRPFYSLLGLHVDCVTQSMDAARRRQAYAAHVTYCTAKELAFDYLRDAMLRTTDLSPLERRARRLAAPAPGRSQPVLRGLCMAILDEADTVLVDEARVPLVLARAEGSALEEAFHAGALAQARELEAGTHYESGAEGRRFVLTPAGRQRLARWPVANHPLLGHRVHRENAVELALLALHGLQRDRDYVVREGAVALVDETTGRAAAGRAWSAGLHQLVELKEGVAATRRNSPHSQTTFQRFFPRYLRLAGASGTVREAARELRQVYGLRLVLVPRRTPSRVASPPLALWPDSAALWPQVAARARALALQGRAVLVGTETVAQSEALSAVLAAQGLPHRVLNARQDREESELIARAGQAGCITVATSMAGRGTDILCAPEVLERGGLHVILCQLNGSARIDRQFLGRAGRQGQPGSAERMLAADFALLQRWCPAWWRRWMARPGAPAGLAKITVAWVQFRQSFTDRYERVKLSRVASEEERDLAFSRTGAA
ncbi:hypothetical protein H8N03_12340 [Ramlibacter sp. USB13]|uniref:Protein translocase subunit SecA n=1 Tax=Ramlibacter cellulosilyticus TaxID=2764187 RepID=A0A923MRT3_9BURK|nr:hypothetical protein [Ramlibacter cellulosilyticus]MBC5783736.1 hypothetical protein [Ramlibacter cellulosilyticus]